MDLGISGRAALVVGGGRGVGRAVAERLAEEGAKVAVLARTASEVEATAKAIGAHAIVGDIGDAETRQRAVQSTPLIVVHAAAAYFQHRKLHNVSEQEISEHLLSDVGAALSLARLVLPGMMLAHFGRIVFIGSVAAHLPLPGAPLYTVVKSALEGAARSIARDYGRYGITANVAALGFVATERFAKRSAEGDLAKGARVLTPREAADAIAFLCSAPASAINGAVIDMSAS